MTYKTLVLVDFWATFLLNYNKDAWTGIATTRTDFYGARSRVISTIFSAENSTKSLLWNPTKSGVIERRDQHVKTMELFW